MNITDRAQLMGKLAECVIHDNLEKAAHILLTCAIEEHLHMHWYTSGDFSETINRLNKARSLIHGD